MKLGNYAHMITLQAARYSAALLSLLRQRDSQTTSLTQKNQHRPTKDTKILK